MNIPHEEIAAPVVALLQENLEELPIKWTLPDRYHPLTLGGRLYFARGTPTESLTFDMLETITRRMRFLCEHGAGVEVRGVKFHIGDGDDNAAVFLATNGDLCVWVRWFSEEN